MTIPLNKLPCSASTSSSPRPQNATNIIDLCSNPLENGDTDLPSLPTLSEEANKSLDQLVEFETLVELNSDDSELNSITRPPVSTTPTSIRNEQEIPQRSHEIPQRGQERHERGGEMPLEPPSHRVQSMIHREVRDVSHMVPYLPDGHSIFLQTKILQEMISDLGSKRKDQIIRVYLKQMLRTNLRILRQYS